MSIDSGNWFHSLNRRLASSALGSWFFSRTLPQLDWLCMRLSGNRTSLTSLLSGLPIIWLTTKGAKSGQLRTVPLVALEDGEQFVLIASNWGQPHHPAWYFNLCAHPEVILFARGRPGVYLARHATPAERDTYWQRAVRLYHGFAVYQQRASGRTIPIIVLTPRME